MKALAELCSVEIQPRNILVTGSHKSGSTWVGRTLSASGQLRYYHEPLNLYNADRFRTPMKHWFEYVGNDPDKQRVYAAYIDYITQGGVRVVVDRLARQGFGKAKQILVEELVKIRDRKERKLLKDPIAVFSADFFYEALGYDVLVVVRHPAAFAESLKTKRWYHDFTHFTAQADLMDNVLGPFCGTLNDFLSSPEKESDIIEHAVLLWNIIHFRILQYREIYGNDWVFVRHEDLSRDSESGFARICDRLDIEFNTAIRAHLKVTTRGEGITGGNRDPEENMKKWTTRLSSSEIQRIYEGTIDIAREFYDESEWTAS